MGHPVLRLPATALAPRLVSTPDTLALIDDMVQTMRDSGGVGIAAPQVHASTRVIAIEIRDPTRYPDTTPFELLVVINPVVTPMTAAQRLGWEGCLSIFGLRGLVPRYEEVRLEGI